MMSGSRDRRRRARTRMWRSSPRCRASYGSQPARASRRASPVTVGAGAAAAGASGVFPEAEFARGIEHASDLGERGGGIGDGAENTHRDDSVEASVLRRERLGRPVDHVDRDSGSASPLGGDGPCGRIGFDRDELRHARRVVLERAPVAAARVRLGRAAPAPGAPGSGQSATGAGRTASNRSPTARL
jgi:hypothetical protein